MQSKKYYQDIGTLLDMFLLLVNIYLRDTIYLVKG